MGKSSQSFLKTGLCTTAFLKSRPIYYSISQKQAYILQHFSKTGQYTKVFLKNMAIYYSISQKHGYLLQVK